MSSYTLGVVRRHIQRADAAVVQKLSAFGVATVHEAMGRVGLMKPYMRPIYAGAHVCGTAVTVLLHPGDNWMMHVAAEQLQEGDVVVAACTAENTDGFFGDLLATSFRARGAKGLVIDGGPVGARDAALDHAELVHGEGAHAHRPFCLSAASRRLKTRRALPSYTCCFCAGVSSVDASM